MERRKLAAVCGAALCFWLFALAVGTSQGVGLNTAFHTSPMNAALVSAPGAGRCSGAGRDGACAVPGCCTDRSGQRYGAL